MSGSIDTSNNTYKEQFNLNHLRLLDNTINTTKRVFRYIISKLEIVIRYIRSAISNYSNQGSTLAERMISVRVNSIKDMKNSDWLMFGCSKDMRLYQADTKKILEIYPQANIFTPPLEVQSTKRKELKSKEEGRKVIYNMVKTMFKEIIEFSQNNHNNSKKTPIAVKLPSFNNIHSELDNMECLETYYHACNQWMINLQLYLNTRVILLICIDSKIKPQKTTAKIEFTKHSKSRPRAEIVNLQQDQDATLRDIHNVNKRLVSPNTSIITAENSQHHSDICDSILSVLYLDYTIPLKLPEKNQRHPIIKTILAENQKSI